VSTRRRTALALTCAAALAGLAVGLPSEAAVAPSAHLSRPLAGGDSGTFPGSEVPVGDADRRGPRLAPLASARAEITRLGGDAVYASWTQYGTPLTLAVEGKVLARGLAGSPEQVSRTFLAQHAGLYGLSASDVADLELLSAESLAGTTLGHVVVLRQRVQGLSLAEDGIVAVTVGKGGTVAVVTSSLVPSALLGRLGSVTPKLSPQEAVLAAARDAGVSNLGLGDLKVGKVDGAGFTHLTTSKLHQPQRTRLRVLGTTDRGARLVYETDVLDVAGGRALATMSFVDARDGKVLLRRDAVDTFAEGTASAPGMRSIGTAAPVAGDPGTFSGEFTADACSDDIPLDNVAEGDQSLVISAITPVVANDIYISVRRNGIEIGNVDTGSSPEAGAVTFDPPVAAADTITAAVCPFDDATLAPRTFDGYYVSSDVAAPDTELPGPFTDGLQFGPATWKVFGSNPTLPLTQAAAADNRYKVCSGQAGDDNPLSQDLSGCDYVYRDGSPLAYDLEPVLGFPTFTSIGNNAATSDARASSSLTPGAPFLPFVSPTRNYAPAFTDVWHTSDCDPASIIGPSQSDISTAITNLFVGHNRAHDFAYRLGLTETTGAMQLSNFGKGGAEADPELGNAQNAALSDDAFTATNEVTGPAAEVALTGRNNANQVTLQDGVPGITNQYLFQPIPTFHGPCADGDLDSGIFIHEYTHAISNRLIGGPDASISGHQGDSMGESWSDLVAVEYLNAFGLAGTGGEDEFALGAYATGNAERGIRDYSANPDKNPLNYSDIGFDSTGPEVHADGEIWNAVQMTVRQALIEKYDSQYPSTDKVLQKACAVGRTASGAVGPTWDKCPGNRRYVAYLFDAMRMQANPAPSMIDMKVVELQAITVRGGADYQVVDDAFASRGIGKGATSKTGADTDPVPSFASATASKNANVTFQLVDAHTGKAVAGSVFVGMYHARCVPVATTLGGKNPDAAASLIAGTYTFTVQAKGYGIQRFTKTLAAGTQTQKLALAQNLASSAYGTAVSGDAGLRLGNAIDDTETTNGAWDGLEDEKPVAGRQITVVFPHGAETFDRVGVSALHHVIEELPEDAEDIQGRFLGVRAFDLQASNDGGQTFTTFYRSSNDFFPSVRPRPVAPDLILREVVLPKPVTAEAIRLVVRSNACTGSSSYNQEEENDPTSPSNCLDSSGTAGKSTLEGYGNRVTLTELQVFKALGSTTPVLVPVTPAPGDGSLAATGGSGALGLGAMLLMGTATAVWVYRRRTA
jgi:hypothetical protein